MDPERIKAIIELTKTSGACEITVETADGLVRVRRRPRVAAAAPEPSTEAPPSTAEATDSEPQLEPELEEIDVGPDGYVVRAANVGWFHRGAGPDAEPFVHVGDQVTTEQPLGTIETLKMSNNVLTEVAGEVVEILVEDGMEVEYGQALFVIRADAE